MAHQGPNNTNLISLCVPLPVRAWVILGLQQHLLIGKEHFS